MKNSILTGMMRPIALFLAPDGAGGAGGSASNTPATDDVIPDDLKVDFGIDLDLLPQEEREKFEAGQKKLQALQKRLMESGKGDQALQQLQNEIAQLRQQQQQPQQRQDDQPKSFRDKMVAHYRSLHIPEAQIPALVQLNGPLFEMLAENFVGHTAEVVAPVSERAMMGELKDVFFDLQDSDPRFTIPEVAEIIWTKSQAITKKGGEVNLDVMRNLGRIAYMEAVDKDPSIATGNPLPSVPARNPQSMPAPNTNTRQTYPGAGSVPRTAPSVIPNNDLDPATAAALAHVRGAWDGYKKDGTKFKQPAARR